MAFKTNWSPLSGFPGRKTAPPGSLRILGMSTANFGHCCDECL
ncbi:hypothetical protein LHGZ1_1570 [Laribacter hongkongensis]|uniref:Uncharacterized protein n=1 Tax=Laribacter hongkongensis TaxID=168471 RepID=A0A248LIU9_9NEIS|nr:hypothetical protein LHGZ1_1570 [Laribacter hongkongensis]